MRALALDNVVQLDGSADTGEADGSLPLPGYCEGGDLVVAGAESAGVGDSDL